MIEMFGKHNFLEMLADTLGIPDGWELCDEPTPHDKLIDAFTYALCFGDGALGFVTLPKELVRPIIAEFDLPTLQSLQDEGGLRIYLLACHVRDELQRRFALSPKNTFDS